jgi:hypothetical protein
MQPSGPCSLSHQYTGHQRGPSLVADRSTIAGLDGMPKVMAAFCSFRHSLILDQLAWVNLQVYTSNTIGCWTFCVRVPIWLYARYVTQMSMSAGSSCLLYRRIAAVISNNHPVTPREFESLRRSTACLQRSRDRSTTSRSQAKHIWTKVTSLPS